MNWRQTSVQKMFPASYTWICLDSTLSKLICSARLLLVDLSESLSILMISSWELVSPTLLSSILAILLLSSLTACNWNFQNEVTFFKSEGKFKVVYNQKVHAYLISLLFDIVFEHIDLPFQHSILPLRCFCIVQCNTVLNSANIMFTAIQYTKAVEWIIFLIDMCRFSPLFY